MLARAAFASILAALALLAEPACAQPALSRAQALAALEQRDVPARLAAIDRLAELGTMTDADRLVARLADDEEDVYTHAAAALWQIWSRSGDETVDALFRLGVAQVSAGELEPALATFDQIVRRKPEFAEGWNKRATVLFLLGRNGQSLKDCDEVLARNRNHFGALSGAAQIHLRLGHFEQARDYLARALQVHPHLEGAREMVRMIEMHLQVQRGKTI